MEKITLGKKGNTITCKNGSNKTFWQIIRAGKVLDAYVFDDYRSERWAEGQEIEAKIKIGEWNQKVTYTIQLPKESNQAPMPLTSPQAVDKDLVSRLNTLEDKINKLSYVLKEITRSMNFDLTEDNKINDQDIPF